MGKKMREGAIIFKHPLPGVLKAPSGIPCMLLTIPYKEKEELIVQVPCKESITCYIYKCYI